MKILNISLILIIALTLLTASVIQIGTDRLESTLNELKTTLSAQI